MKPQKITEIRTRLGITQADLAKILGCSLHSVEHWSRGYRSPNETFELRLTRLDRLAKSGKPIDIKAIQKEEE